MFGNKVLIIAEAGVNHNGDMGLARELIHAAAEAGADVVKFQTFKASNLVSQNAPKADYQLQSTSTQESQLEMLRKLEIPFGEHMKLKELCQKLGIEFMSTPFDTESADFLIGIGVTRLKIPSGEITNYPFLRHIARFRLPIIFSTGMATLQEVDDCLKVLLEHGANRKKITILHCNTEYPTPMEDVNLNVLQTLRDRFRVPIGYSDHTMGIEVPIAATALGASLIEKHFTLSRTMSGPDHKASLEPPELKAMVQAIRNVSEALGKSEKVPTPSESKNIVIARKSLVASKAIKKDEIFTEDNITSKRPGNGISPMRWKEFIGKTSSRDYSPDELLQEQ